MVILIKPSSCLCNMKCRYCFYHDESERRTQKNYGLMSTETASILISKVLKHCRKTCTFAFQGGEPTLRGYDFFKEFVMITKELNIHNKKVHYAIQTNGLSINHEFAQFFHDNHFLVGLSVDGMRNIHDAIRIDQNGNPTFERTIIAAELLNQHHVDYNVLCVVNSYNAKKPERLYHFFRSYGFQYLQFIPCLSPIGDMDASYTLKSDQYALFLKGIFDRWYNDLQKGNYVSIRMFDNIINMLCGYPPENCAMKGRCSVNMVVEADGSVFPCDFYAVDEWLIGNIHTNSVEEMLLHPKSKVFSARTAQTAKCHTCNYFTLCRGGCPRESEAVPNGGAPYFCDAMTDFFEYTIERFKKAAEYCLKRT